MGDFRDQLLWPSFLEYQGLLSWLPKGSSACRAAIFSQGNTSYCEHHPEMVRHPPSQSLLLPTKSVLALSTALCFSLSGPKDYEEVLFEAGCRGSPSPGLWIDRSSLGLIVDSNPPCRQISSLPIIALSETDRGGFTGNPVLKNEQIETGKVN